MPKIVKKGQHKKPASLRHTDATKDFLKDIGEGSAQKGYDLILAFSIKYEPMLKKFIDGAKDGKS